MPLALAKSYTLQQDCSPYVKVTWGLQHGVPSEPQEQMQGKILRVGHPYTIHTAPEKL